MTNKRCELDPMPTLFAKEAIETLAPIIAYIVNGSLMSGVFPSCYNSLVHLSKKYFTTPNKLQQNVCQVYNLCKIVVDNILKIDQNRNVACG